MKVEVRFTLDVDAEAWALEYGMEVSEVRADVKVLAEGTVRSHLGSMGLLAKEDGQ